MPLRTLNVLLDEVGLAEESPHLPLKVLHKELEDLQGISCVGTKSEAWQPRQLGSIGSIQRTTHAPPACR